MQHLPNHDTSSRTHRACTLDFVPEYHLNSLCKIVDGSRFDWIGVPLGSLPFACIFEFEFAHTFPSLQLEELQDTFPGRLETQIMMCVSRSGNNHRSRREMNIFIVGVTVWKDTVLVVAPMSTGNGMPGLNG